MYACELYLENTDPTLQHKTINTFVHGVKNQRFQYNLYHRKRVYYFVT